MNPDEEDRQQSSRAGTEELAKQSQAVLVLEPGTGLEGKPRRRAKESALSRLKVRGIASHAGVDFAKGSSAVVEMARQIEVIAGIHRSQARHHGESRRRLRRHPIERNRSRSRRPKSTSVSLASATRKRSIRNSAR